MSWKWSKLTIKPAFLELIKLLIIVNTKFEQKCRRIISRKSNIIKTVKKIWSKVLKGEI
jgi:hypothetical protein